MLDLAIIPLLEPHSLGAYEAAYSVGAYSLGVYSLGAGCPGAYSGPRAMEFWI